MTTFIRGTHPYAFRSGEWAVLEYVDTVLLHSEERQCFRVRFEDGVDDLWPVHNSGYDYELKDVYGTQFP